MSIRAVGTRLLKNGQIYVRSFCRQYNSSNIAEQANAIKDVAANTAKVAKPSVAVTNFSLRNVGVQVGLHARRLLIDNVLNRVTNSLAADLRKRAARRILFGDSSQFFAFVGVSLASGSGILTKEEELEGVCWEIRDAVSKVKLSVYPKDEISTDVETETLTVDNFTFDKPIAKGANAVVYSAGMKNEGSSIFPFAIKMMFNYGVQSNATTILRAMHKETVPTRHYANNLAEFNVDDGFRLPSHPNIVEMKTVFADYVPELPGIKELCPAALPTRIYPDGDGRNMSLFLVMKRYDYSLAQFLALNRPSLKVSYLLFTQLLEGVVHLNLHGVAHRDLKSDNLLVDLAEETAPILVITDFGCCLNKGLILPYNTEEIDKGGNAALMAPEIINQKHGTFSELNYHKSDLWACGTIAYELFGNENPFYGGKLRNANYKDENLPKLPDEVSNLMKVLVYNILHRNPKMRVSPELAANVCQLFLWAPSNWLKSNHKIPTSTEILEWLLCMTTKVLCEGRLNNVAVTANSNKAGRRTYPEYLLIASFLRRANLSSIRSALTWIHNNI